MSAERFVTNLSFSAPDRGALLAQLCAELTAAFALERAGNHGDTVLLHPWQATADSFEDLPGLVIEAMLDEWDDAGAALAEAELGGYMTTDQGHRAWGVVAVHDGVLPEHERPEIDRVSVDANGAGYRFEARIRRSPHPAGDADV